ncbi:MAG: HAD hydrolase-like protein [Firmicutes bacterium]|nr:HAD hydrolase-like protein [Bacillota bacterium]MCL5014893.1 HAD hydrolase-like protein [Bacillota bacterium]
MEKPVIVFDLDGTLYRGDAPYWYYAQRVSRFLEEAEAESYLRRVHEHLTGRTVVESADNWEAVVRLMEPFGQKLPVDQWQEAFRETRRYMLSRECPLEVPVGLPELLKDIKDDVFVAVATNSPYEAAWPLLEQIGLISYFDVIRTEAKKPEGIVELLREVTGANYRPDRVFSIGDHYYNDIAPGVREGWTTGHISPRRIFPGPATYLVAQAEELFEPLKAWIRIGTKREG